MIVLILFLLVYVTSVIGVYKCLQICYYHPKGRWNAITPDEYDLIMTFFPIINTALLASFIFGKGVYYKSPKESKVILFFKPKKSFEK